MPAHEPFNFHSLGELRNRIGELGLDLPVADDASPLLEPLELNGFRLPNRLVVLPMEGCDGIADGSPDELTFRRYRRFAAGGAGLLWLEATAVVEEGRANPRQLWIRDETLPAFAALARRTSAAKPWRPIAPTACSSSPTPAATADPGARPSPSSPTTPRTSTPSTSCLPITRVITDDELERLEDRYVDAARLARAPASTPWTSRPATATWSPNCTPRTRAKAATAAPSRTARASSATWCARSASAVPGLIVTSRMNAYDAMAYPYGFGVDREDAAKPDLAEPIELVRFLQEAGAPLVNITIGNPYFNPHVNRPFDLPVSGAPLPAGASARAWRASSDIVRRIQAEFPGHGCHRRRLLLAAAVLPECGRRDRAQRLGVAGRRGPHVLRLSRISPATWPKRGRLDPEKVCVACSACTQIMRDGGRTGCVPRDAAIYEPIYKAGRAEALDTILADGQDLPAVQRPHLRDRLPRPREHSRVRRAHRRRPLPRGLRDAARRQRAGRRLRLRLPVRDAVRSRLHQPALHRDRAHPPPAALGEPQGRRGGLGGRAAPGRPAQRQTRRGARRRTGGHLRRRGAGFAAATR